MNSVIKHIGIKTRSIRLDQFLKWAGIVSTGGEAKELILSGVVKVNNNKANHRSSELVPGDEVMVEGVCYKIEADPVEKF